MAAYIMTSFSNARAGRDAEYLNWYENTHLPEVLRLPEVKAGRMLEAIPASPNDGITTYLAIYELDIDDPGAFLRGMGERGKSGALTPTDSVDPASVRMTMYAQKF